MEAGPVELGLKLHDDEDVDLDYFWFVLTCQWRSECWRCSSQGTVKELHCMESTTSTYQCHRDLAV